MKDLPIVHNNRIYKAFGRVMFEHLRSNTSVYPSFYEYFELDGMRKSLS